MNERRRLAVELANRLIAASCHDVVEWQRVGNSEEASDLTARLEGGYVYLMPGGRLAIFDEDGDELGKVRNGTPGLRYDLDMCHQKLLAEVLEKEKCENQCAEKLQKLVDSLELPEEEEPFEDEEDEDEDESVNLEDEALAFENAMGEQAEEFYQEIAEKAEDLDSLPLDRKRAKKKVVKKKRKKKPTK